MITIYRDEHNKLQQSIVEENPKYLSLGQEVFINHKKFVITNIEKTELKRVVHMMVVGSNYMTKLEFRAKRGDYELTEKNKQMVR